MTNIVQRYLRHFFEKSKDKSLKRLRFHRLKASDLPKWSKNSRFFAGESKFKETSWNLAWSKSSHKVDLITLFKHTHNSLPEFYNVFYELPAGYEPRSNLTPAHSKPSHLLAFYNIHSRCFSILIVQTFNGVEIITGGDRTSRNKNLPDLDFGKEAFFTWREKAFRKNKGKKSGIYAVFNYWIQMHVSNKSLLIIEIKIVAIDALLATRNKFSIE